MKFYIIMDSLSLSKHLNLQETYRTILCCEESLTDEEDKGLLPEAAAAAGEAETAEMAVLAAAVTLTRLKQCRNIFIR